MNISKDATITIRTFDPETGFVHISIPLSEFIKHILVSCELDDVETSPNVFQSGGSAKCETRWKEESKV